MADALSLCEVAFSAVRRDVSEGEIARIEHLHACQIKETREKLEREKSALAQENLQIKNDAKSQAQESERRYREERENALEQLREQHRKASTVQEEIFSELEAKLKAARTSKQEAIEEALEKQRRQLNEDASQREHKLNQTVESLRKELEDIKDSSAKSLLEEMKRRESFQQAKDDLHAKHHESIVKILQEGIKKRDADIANAEERIAALIGEDRQRLEQLVKQQSDAMTRFSGVASRGHLGERIVAHIFARLQLGEYIDESGVPGDGYADGLWVYQPSACVPRLSAIVEVKNAQMLHSQKDIGKFQRDLLAGVESTRVNAGLFLSLGCRYAGKPPLQLVIEHGIPVCYASREEDDALPVSCMIELAVRSLAEAWPLICRQRGEGVQLTVAAASEQFEKLMQDCQNFSKHIAKITKAAKTQLVEAQQLVKIRDRMVQGIDAVRINHPSLVPEALDKNEDEQCTADEMTTPSTSSSGDRCVSVEGQLCLSAFREGRSGRTYPNRPQCIASSKEVLQKEVQSSTRGKKRKVQSTILPPEDFTSQLMYA